MMTSVKKAWINAALLLVTLVINTLGAIGLINGSTQKEISDRYMTLITPGPSTFSIWSVIYALLIASVLVMALKKNDPYYQRAVDELTVWFRVSSILNLAWIVAFSFEQLELSLLLILAFAVSLALLGQRLLKIQKGRRWLLPLSFGLYNGWLMIATVVNAAAMLVKLDWGGFGLTDEIWAIAILAIAILLVIIVVARLRNAVLPLPVAWAYLGINQFLGSPAGFDNQYPTLAVAALIGMGLLVAVAVIQFVRNRFSVLPESVT